ncbi:MAG TPA: AAA-associated domain-containing protein [Roseiflexaceae bacterium]|nr:AAA-associated domain-containing protein [Roseiflexaceae bacterium]
MSVETVGIPQADVLWDVARVPEAILRGRDTPDAIGDYIGAKGQRQGLYYTQAARVLGLVGDTTPDGKVELTAYGRAFAQYDRSSQRQAMRRLLREHEPTRSVIEALKAGGGLDWDDIARVLQQLAPLAESTAQRRARTAAAWLVAAGLAQWRDGRLHYRSLPPANGFAR